MSLVKILSIFLLYGFVSCEYYTTTLSTSGTVFQFIGKFALLQSSVCDISAPDCYSGTANFVITAEDPANAPTGMTLYVYDDEDSSWPSIYKKDLSCTEAISKAKNLNRNGFDVVFQNGVFTSANLKLYEFHMPRFWYFVVANCGSSPPTPGPATASKITVNAHFLNHATSWYTEFGYNYWNLNTIYILFFILYFAIACIWIYGLKLYREIDGNSTPHPLISLISTVLLFQFFAVLLFLCDFGAFTNNGRGLPIAGTSAQFVSAFAETLFVLILILMAQGWTISTVSLENRGKNLGVFLSLLVLNIVVLIWSKTSFDPAATNYLFDSIPGYIFVTVKAVYGIYFVYSAYITYSNESEESKKSLYSKLLTVYSFWFFVPILVVLISMALNAVYREVAVVSVCLVVSSAAYFILLYFLWPTRASKYFQINPMSDLSTSYATLGDQASL